MSNLKGEGQRARRLVLQHIASGAGRAEITAEVRLCRELGFFHPLLAEDLIALACKDKSKRCPKARQLLAELPRQLGDPPRGSE